MRGGQRGATPILFGIAVIGVVILVGTGAPSVVADNSRPRVIGGNPASSLAPASVLYTTGDFWCTAGLWKSRILVTAAHCISDGKGSPGAEPTAVTVYPPGSDRRGGPSSVKVTNIIYDNSWEGVDEDIAFLILDAPLGSPIITRMAGESEVQALSKSHTNATYVGYGMTQGRQTETPGSDTPLEVVEPLRPTTGGSSTVFEIQGDGTKGTCAGDSGGPWMVRTATEVLLIGPLQGGLGQPCDAPESPSETYETGAVAILHGDFIQQALRETGEPADVMPSACLEGRDLPRVCTSDRTWVYDYCWSGKKATLAQQVNGAWQQVAKLTGKKYAKCGKKYPYRILFTRTDAPGTYAYKVTVGKTADEFTATVS